jgi:mannosyltransferase
VSRRGAAAAVAIVATSPFALFFATEARMYALVMLLTALAALAVVRVLEQPSWRRATAVAFVTAALLLTHYWSGFLVAAAVVALVVGAVKRRPSRRACVTALTGIAGGVLLFLPWLPELLFQFRHTGTPWARTPNLSTIGTVFAEWSAPAQTISFRGLPRPAFLFSLMLAVALFALCVVAVVGAVGRRSDSTDRHLGARTLAGVGIGALVLAVVVAQLTHGGYEPRYTAPMAVLLSLVAGVGVARLPVRWRAGTVGVVAALGLLSSGLAMAQPSKTQAAEIAAQVRHSAHPGDVVVYCPDQLGPAVSRLLPAGLRQLTFPSGASPTTVDWVDYAQRNEAASPAAFASRLTTLAGRSTIWVVDVPHGYATLGTKCRQVLTLLATDRPTQVVVRAQPRAFYEFANLIRLDPEVGG